MEEKKKELQDVQAESVTGGTASAPRSIICPNCRCDRCYVIENYNEGKRRRRKVRCPECGNEFTI